MELAWNVLKNERLKKTRGASFDDLIDSRLIAVKRHPTKDHQNLMLFYYRGYIWVVPFVRDGEKIFLKTLFPSRKYTRLHKKGELK